MKQHPTDAYSEGSGRSRAAKNLESAKRAYRSPLRQTQVAQTRELIVEALAEQVWKEGLADFSVPKVAKRANVSTRTVYRYFPSRDDLLDAVGEWVHKYAPEPEYPRSLSDISRYVRALYTWFASHAQLVDLQGLSELSREVHARGRTKRAALTRQVLAEWMPDIKDERERWRRFAPIRVLLGSRAWLQLTRDLELSNEEAIDVATKSIEILLRSYRSGE